MEKKNLFRFFGRFLAYAFLVIVIIGSTVVVSYFGPTQYNYTDDAWEDAGVIDPPGFNSSLYNVVLDHHSHTLYSDGYLTIEQNILWHISMGFNAIFLTDHNTLENAEELQHLQAKYIEQNFLIMQGMEWTTNRIHLNLLGISEWKIDIPSNPSDQQIIDAIEETHARGGVVVVNHIPWSTEQFHMRTHPTREQLAEWGVDFIEIVNDATHPSISYDAESVDFCEENGIGQITGTDMHKPDKHATRGVTGWTYLHVSNFTEDAIMDQLRNRNTTISHSRVPYLDRGIYEEDPQYRYVKIFDQIGSYFMGIYTDPDFNVQIGMLVSFFLGIFIIMEIYNVIRPKFWNVINKKKSDNIKNE